MAMVDFYPQLRVVADSTLETEFEIADIERIELLDVIENGHTIDLSTDGFVAKYDLEGSAKAIERIRDCFADR